MARKNSGLVWDNMPGVASLAAQQPDGSVSKGTKRYNKAFRAVIPAGRDLNKGPNMSGTIGAAGADKIRQFTSSRKRK